MQNIFLGFHKKEHTLYLDWVLTRARTSTHLCHTLNVPQECATKTKQSTKVCYDLCPLGERVFVLLCATEIGGYLVRAWHWLLSSTVPEYAPALHVECSTSALDVQCVRTSMHLRARSTRDVQIVCCTHYLR